MAVASTATPSTTAATSPTLPITPATTGDCLINIGADPEKASYHEKNSDADKTKPAEGQGSGNAAFPTRFTRYLRKASFSASFPYVSWRRRDGREKLVQRIDDHPEGYPQLAAFIDCDENFLMCRRFGFLHSRVLLYRQDELSKLETTLIQMDDEDKRDYPLTLKSRKTDEAREDVEAEYSRKTLINKIDDKLKEYDDVVQRVKSFVSLKKPSNRNFNSFAAWILNNKPVTREEMVFLKHGEDFVALADGEEGGWFDGFVEDCLGLLPHRLAQLFPAYHSHIVQKVLSSPEQLKKSDDAYVHLYSKYRIDVLVRLILTVISVILLMAPTALLFLVPDHPKLKIILIMIFTLLFSAALGVFTKAKRHEMFAATAA